MATDTFPSKMGRLRIPRRRRESFAIRSLRPPAYPGLNPIDYFFWGNLQCEVVRLRPEAETALRLPSVRAASEAPLALFRRGIGGFYRRVCSSIAAQVKASNHMLRGKILTAFRP